MNEKLVYRIGGFVAYFLAFLWLVPLLWALSISLKPVGSAVIEVKSWVNPPFTLDNYTAVFEQAPVVLWLWNSLLVAVLTTLFVLVVTTLAAFPLSLGRFYGDRPLFMLIAIGIMIPGEAMLIPLYILTRDLNILDSYSALILPSLAVPFGIILLRQFFRVLPKEMFEAAEIDGCGTLRKLVKITIPLSRPVLASLAIFTFLGSWNNFLWPFISTTTDTRMTVPVGIPYFNSSYHSDFILPMAANIVTMLPVIAAFLIFQRQIIKGISFTGSK